jgi:hypothetical protein
VLRRRRKLERKWQRRRKSELREWQRRRKSEQGRSYVSGEDGSRSYVSGEGGSQSYTDEGSQSHHSGERKEATSVAKKERKEATTAAKKRVASLKKVTAAT